MSHLCTTDYATGCANVAALRHLTVLHKTSLFSLLAAVSAKIDRRRGRAVPVLDFGGAFYIRCCTLYVSKLTLKMAKIFSLSQGLDELDIDIEQDSDSGSEFATDDEFDEDYDVDMIKQFYLL